MKKIESTTKHMAASGIIKLLSMLLSLVYVPIVLDFLGEEKYGVWATILAIVSWFSYFDVGIGNGLRNRLTEALSDGDRERGRKLVSSSYAFISLIMFLAFAVFALVAVFLDWNVILGVTSIDEDLRAVVLISVLFISFNFVLALCYNVLYALQKASYAMIISLIAQGANLLIILCCRLFIKENLLVVAIVYGGSLVLVNLLCNIVIFHREKTLCPSVKSVDLAVGKELVSLGLKFFLIQICGLILYSTDSLIISYLFGASDVTPYSIVNKLFTAIAGAYTALLLPIWNAVTKLKIDGDFTKIKNTLKKLWLLMSLVGVVAVFCCVFFPVIAKIWLRKELFFEPWLVVLGGAYCVIMMWNNTYTTVANGLELMKVSIVVALVQAVLNIPLSLFFALGLGLGETGIFLGTVVVMVIAAVVIPIAVHTYINK